MVRTHQYHKQHALVEAMAITQAYVDEYKSYLFEKKAALTTTEQETAKQLGEKRKAFLKRAAKELGTTAKKLEKDIGKLLKKEQPKPTKTPYVNKEKSPSTIAERDEFMTSLDEDKIESSSTTLKRELKPPTENVGRGGYYVNSKDILEKHVSETKGRWMTRFPPEPNGHLHIGHAKAMLVDFGTAKEHSGCCYLRFDDTNPTGEKQEYIDGIELNVKWLGHSWFRRTFTSDYFPQLYELAKELIRRDKAYVCHQTADEVKTGRAELMKYHTSAEEEKGEIPSTAFSPYRNRPVEESLRLFEHMRQGRFAEGEATLRMKMDLSSPNPNMWDLMAYRIIYKEHPRTKDNWCIYPTYDFSHCLVDSLENISHSLCSLEFESRQSINGSYHWLLHALDMYHPQTWEFSRCSISCNVMSKRRLKTLVEEGHVMGWDDPRLLTLDGLRRRGYTPSSINSFSESIGVARSSNEVCVAKELLEHIIRKELNDIAERRFAVLEPLKVNILNFDKCGRSKVEVPKYPQKPEEGSRTVEYTDTVYIPRQKFLLKKEKGYKGLVKGGKAKLLYADQIRCVDVRSSDSGVVEEIMVEILSGDDMEEKGLDSICWVPKSAILCEARLFEPLFVNCEVDGVEVNAEKATKAKGLDSFLDLLNKDSMRKEKILVEPNVAEAADGSIDEKKRYQFMTVGYFVADKDSTLEKPIFNRVVTLRESKSFKEFKAER